MGRACLPLLLSVFSPGRTRHDSHSWAQAQRVCKPRVFSDELPDSVYTPHCSSPSRLKHTIMTNSYRLAVAKRNKTLGEVKIEPDDGDDWFRTINDAASKKILFFHMGTPHMSKKEFQDIPFPATTLSQIQKYTRYGPDIPHPEFPHRIMIYDASEFFNDDDQSKYVWEMVGNPTISVKVSRIFGHCSGGLTLRSCIANQSPASQMPPRLRSTSTMTTTVAVTP